MCTVWKSAISQGIQINPDLSISNILFANDEVIVQRTEDDLQRALFYLIGLSSQYNMKISLTKTKVMEFMGKFPVRSKIVLGDKILERMSHFNYLGSDVTYENDGNCDKNVSRFQAICGTIRRTLHRKLLNETQMKLYKVMAVPTLLYGSEDWIL
ncbi:uncharacterized protein LOC142319905 [Lycorma delicatula]|uniref:uncharacterized protein LOC142319905 n=1 Tax=Lycorma delicatula TaxID=130591 RepID=UPI003F5111B9